ncbi:MAG: ABC transporter substrate-binding protein [Ignavibacteriae bacterium]|nr:ABC transporter substrate-binding protein [Ignavibacteriota bacterium]MCB9216103.1 ABC transporter substrate-binding protein [Ignavibacteria bacterium]
MKRVLSLLPSTTEIVYELGREDSLVGVTHECDFPDEAKRKPQVTSAKIHPEMESKVIDQLVREQLDDSGTLYTLDMNLVRKLKPEVVLTQQLCTVCAVGFETVQKAMLSLPEPPEVVNIEPKSLEEVFDSVHQISQLIGCEEIGRILSDTLRSSFNSIKKADSPRVLFLEWLIPPFSAGHWMPELVIGAGGIPILANPSSHSRQLSWEQIRSEDFDVLVISCCGFSVERAMLDIEESEELQHILAERPSLQLIIFDGNHFFSRPGPRLVESARLLAEALRGTSPENVNSSIPFPYRLVR